MACVKKTLFSVTNTLYTLVFITNVIVVLAQEPNNVCRTLEAYFTNIQENPKCWHDSDVGAPPETVANNHGLTLERYLVKTEDDYVLQTFRLKSLKGTYGKRPVFLQHGLGSNGMCFLFNGNKSIALFLVKQGYDVWIGNFRGSVYSSHKSFRRDNPKFWDFSFHEHGLYDVPANLKYIYGKTKQKIIYIGHSMGSTSMGIYASTKPAETQKYVTHAILLCGTFYMNNTAGLVANDMTKNLYPVLPLLHTVKMNVIFGENSFEARMFRQFCFSNIESAYVCLDILENLMGPVIIPIPKEKLPGLLELLSNACLKSVLHYSQLIQSCDYRMFDYGTEENLKRYNSTTPPRYNLPNITIPIILVYGEMDILASKQDTIWVYQTFGKDNWELYEVPGYNHITFLVDSKVEKNFFPLLSKIVNKY